MDWVRDSFTLFRIGINSNRFLPIRRGLTSRNIRGISEDVNCFFKQRSLNDTIKNVVDYNVKLENMSGYQLREMYFFFKLSDLSVINRR